MFRPLVKSVDPRRACIQSIRKITKQQCYHPPSPHTSTPQQTSHTPRLQSCLHYAHRRSYLSTSGDAQSDSTVNQANTQSFTTDTNSSDNDIQPSLEVYAREVKDRTEGVVPGQGPPPEVPTTCCNSGCANCVWIDYAEELKNYYKDGGENARKAIMKEVEDPNLRAYLLLEIS